MPPPVETPPPASKKPTQPEPRVDPRDIGVRFGPMLTEEQFRALQAKKNMCRLNK